MSIFYCQECGHYRDCDEDECYPDPKNDTLLVCGDCHQELEAEAENTGPLADDGDYSLDCWRDR